MLESRKQRRTAMKKEITWTTGTGKEAKVEIVLRLEKILDADGDKITVPCCEMDVIASIEGIGYVGSGRPRAANQQGCVARIDKLGINAENLARINIAIAEIEATPEWVAKVARLEANRKSGEEYDKHRAMMRRVMGY